MKAAALPLALCASPCLLLCACLTAGQAPVAAYGPGAYPGAPPPGYAVAAPQPGWGVPHQPDPRAYGAPAAPGAAYGAAYGAAAPGPNPSAPWPNPNPAGLPAFGSAVDVSAGAETRAQAFGEPPAVTLGTARSVQPGSTGVSGAAASARPATPNSVPFGPDGGAALARPQGSLQPLEQPTRSLPEAVQSRSLLIDDYSRVLDERDALRAENASLQEHIRELESRLLAAEKGLGAGKSEARASEERVAQLQYQLDLSEQERADLEARLVTAQIRRLEAEKSLLEAWIESEQQRSADPAAPTAPGAATSAGAAPGAGADSGVAPGPEKPAPAATGASAPDPASAPSAGRGRS